MYPVPEFDPMLNLHYTQDFPPVYTRQPSVDVYAAAQDMSLPFDYPALYYYYSSIPYGFSDAPTQEPHLYAPMPVPIIHSTGVQAPNNSPSYMGQGYQGSNSNYAQVLSPASDATSSTATLDCHTNVPQFLFQTPSELLTDLSTTTAPISTGLPSTSTLAHPTRPVQSQSSGRISIDAPTSPPRAVNKAESQRKARQRAIAEEIGFIPTDPDTISSHEKKRYYLECLEHYILYLHEQLHLVNTVPAPLERVSSYRGLSSRSIRTLLVHMQNVNRRLNQDTLAEEQVFLNLSEEVMDAQGEDFPTRCHSVDDIRQTASSQMFPFGAASTGDDECAISGFGVASSSGVDLPQRY